MRRRRARISNVAAGGIGVVLIVVICWVVFGGPIPFSGGGFKLKAVYTSQTELHLASPVRIAGVDVGTVTQIKHIGGNSPATLVTMSITGEGLPIHADATTNIRPRLFLEGNYYVNLQPGTPQAPALSSGATLSSPHNSGPVQLDRVLSALNSNARANLQTLLQGLGSSLNRVPTAAQDASQDPSQRGLTAGQSLNESLKYSANAFKASAIVNQAFLGERPHDLSGAVAGTEKFFSGLAADQNALSGLVTTFNATMRALANRQQDLSDTIALLPGTLQATNSALGPLQASFGPTQRFAAAILPGVKQTGPTIAAGLPWLAQTAGARLSSRTGWPADVPDAGDPGHRHDGRLAQATAARLRSVGRLLHAHDHPDRERAGLRSAADDRSAGLPGAVPGSGRAGVGVGRVRRQRSLHPLHAGRR